MTGRRHVWALTALLLAGAGCADGDLITLTPPGAPCAYPGDPDWSPLISSIGRVYLRDVVQVDADLAVAVGVGGRAFVRSGQVWREEATSTDRTLLRAAVLDGEAWAVGWEGAVVRRTSSGWLEYGIPGTPNLRDLAAAADTLWAVGNGGALAAITGAGPVLVGVPTAENLTSVAVRADTLWVGDGRGRLLVRAGGRWSEVTTPCPPDDYIRAIGHLPDGRLVLAGWNWGAVREAEGWRPLTTEGVTSGVWRFKADGDVLWFETYGTAYATRDAVTFSPLVLSGQPSGVRVAPLSGAPLLAVSSGGDLYTVLADGTALRDPASSVYGLRAFRLADGTAGVVSNLGIHRLGPAGLEPLHAPEPGEPGLQDVDQIAGRAPEDFYAIDGFRLYRHRDGVTTSSVPCDTCRLESLAVLPDGRVLLGDDNVIWELVGEGLETVHRASGENHVYDDLQLASSPAGDVLAVGRSRALIARAGGDFVDFGLTRGAEYGGFLPDGRAVVVAVNPGAGGYVFDGWHLVVDAGPGLEPEVIAIPRIDHCPGTRVEGCFSTPAAFYLWTREPNLVYRLEGDPVHDNWALVAGPQEDEIEQIVIAEDGAVLAVDRDEEQAFFHPGNRP